MSKFTLFKKTITFSEASDHYFMAQLEWFDWLLKADRDFYEYYESKGNIRAVLQDYADFAEAILHKRVLSVLHNRLPTLGIYDISSDKFCDRCLDVSAIDDAFDEIAGEYNAIEEELALEKAYREERKASRGQWQGGGFGLGGAIKGAAAAGALNMASGLGHSLFNAIGNAGSSMAAANSKERLYYNEETYECLSNGICQSVRNTYFEYMNMINEYFKDELYFSNSQFDEDRAEALFENAKRIPEKREELLVEALQLQPDFEEALAYVFENYPAERKTACEMAEFFCVDISNCYENVFEKQFKEAKKSGEEGLLAARAAILADMNTYGIKSSDTLTELDKHYMNQVYAHGYQKAVFGNRSEALELLRNFGTTDNLKKDFVKVNGIWEMCRECGVVFEDETKRELIKNNYTALLKQKASEAKLTAFLDEVLIALEYKDANGFRSDETKEDVFFLLCDREKYELVANKAAWEKKEELLAQSVRRLETLTTSLSAIEKEYLFLGKRQANDKANKQEIATLTPGEYILAMYVASSNDDPKYRRGFILTDKALTNKGDSETCVPISSAPQFRGGGFLSDSISVTYTKGGIELTTKMDATRITAKKDVANCLQQVTNELYGKQDELKLIDIEHEEDTKQQMALCFEENPFLVSYFGMAEKAASAAAEGADAADGCKLREIETLMNSVDSTDENSIVATWSELLNGKFTPEMIAAHRETLCAYLCKIAGLADCLQVLERVEVARQKLLSLGEKEMMQTLKDVMDSRHDTAAELGEITRQKQVTADIMKSCNCTNVMSVLTAWDAFVNSGCEERYYAEYVKTLNKALSDLLYAANTIESVTALRDRLVNSNGERYQKLIQYAEEKINQMDQAARTYRGVVFDSQEDIIAAQEEEKRLDIIMRMVVQEDAASVESAISQISQSPSKIKEVYLETLNGYLTAIGEQMKTYRGVVYATVEEAEEAKRCYVETRDILERVDMATEQSVADAYERISAMNHPITQEALTMLKTRLDAIDLQKRTVEGLVFDTLEQADVAREELNLIRSRLAELNENDEAGMLSIRDAIAACTTDVKTQYLALVNAKLEAYDIRVRTVAGVLYATREEARLVESELQRAAEIMATVSADDEASILNAQQAVLELTTFVKDVKYQELNKMWTAYDLAARTFLQIEFATRKQAQTAREEYTEFMNLYSTLDLSQRDSVLQLRHFVEDRIPAELTQKAMAIVQDLNNVLDIIDYILQQDSVIDMVNQKKESADLYKHIEGIIPRMAKYRIDTTRMQQLKEKHYASLNAVKKLFSFFKSKM